MFVRSRRPTPPRVARLGPGVRRFLARRPWIRWSLVLALAAASGALVWSALEDVERARASWTDTRTVLVADGDHEAGDPLTTRVVELPLAAAPPDAHRPGDLDDDARSTQRLADGEPVVAFDVAGPPGPAGLAPDGTVVVAIADPLVPAAPLGSTVAVFAEGIVLAESGRVVTVTETGILVAVAADDAPLVAAAAQTRSASIAFVIP